jgi:hypothetical protein
MPTARDNKTSTTDDSKANTTGGDSPATVEQTTPGTPGPLQSDANPTGAANHSTGPVGTPEVIEGAEHVLGDDPRRVVNQAGYHDAVSGRAITEDGHFVDEPDRAPVEKHRIVANDWGTSRERINDPAKRVQ